MKVLLEAFLSNYQISIVHGKMKSEDKSYEMERFKKGKTQIMVATTVIEVGVNIPNASVMIIESADVLVIAITSIKRTCRKG